MDVFKTIKPNEAGSKRLVRQYGDKLVAVRYRKGTNPDVIYKTVEIIVDSKPYYPGITHAPAASAKCKEIVPLRISFNEVELRAQVKKAGGQWKPTEKRWYLSYKKVCDLKLKHRILGVTNI